MTETGLAYYKDAVLCGSFLDAISHGNGISDATRDVFLRLVGRTETLSTESLNNNLSTEDIVGFAQESYEISLVGYIGAVVAAVSAPLKALSVAEKYLVDISQMTIRALGKSTGMYNGTLTEEQITLIIRGVEASAGLALLYYTGIGSAIVKAAKSPQNAKTFVGGFITKLSEFKWPFGSIKAGWRTARVAFVQFKKNVAMDMQSTAKWGAKPAVTFMSKAIRAISSAVERIARGTASGLSRFAQSVKSIIIKPAFVTPFEKMAYAYKNTRKLTSVALTESVRLLGGFGVMMVVRFVCAVIKQSIGLLVEFCKKLTRSDPEPENHFH